MPRKDHTEEQIVGVLRQVEAAARVAEIYRKVGDQPGDVLSVETEDMLSTRGAIWFASGDRRRRLSTSSR